MQSWSDACTTRISVMTDRAFQLLIGNNPRSIGTTSTEMQLGMQEPRRKAYKMSFEKNEGKL